MQWLDSLFFAGKVGARGYCSTSLKSCLLRVGFPGELVWPILKFLIPATLKASFQIWQNGDSKECIGTTSDPVINVNLKNYKRSPLSSKPIHSEKVQAPVDFANNKPSAKPYVSCQLLHKCFPSVSQPHGTVIVKFRFCNNPLSPFTSCFVRIMSLLRSSKSPLDPTQFL